MVGLVLAETKKNKVPFFIQMLLIHCGNEANKGRSRIRCGTCRACPAGLQSFVIVLG